MTPYMRSLVHSLSFGVDLRFDWRIDSHLELNAKEHHARSNEAACSSRRICAGNLGQNES